MCYNKYSGSNRWKWILSKKVKYENMSKKCHITLIKSIRLESVKFILPKRLSSPKIVHTICLINEGNFPITYTVMFVIFKMSVKWCLFDGIPFNETPMGWLVIVKSRFKFGPKFSGDIRSSVISVSVKLMTACLYMMLSSIYPLFLYYFSVFQIYWKRGSSFLWILFPRIFP